jgi:DNA replication protein DnaC
LPESAQSWLSSIKRYKILFLSDLAAQKADKSTEPGTSPLANLLLSLLSSFSGRVVFDSNLDSDKLRAHPDMGARIVSRLFADRGGAACEVLTLSGADQRQHLLRSEKR